MRGHDFTDFTGGINLAGALAAVLGEFADEVFVTLADDVRFDIFKSQAFGADGLDEVGETIVIKIALAVGGGIEIHAVNDAFQQRIFTSDSPHMGGDAFTNLIRKLTNDRPDRLFGIIRFKGEVKADKFMVCINELEGLLPRANLHGNTIHFVIEDVAQALGEDEGEDIILVFCCVLGPAYGAGSIPYPGFEGFVFGNRFSHTGVFFRSRKLAAFNGSDTMPGLYRT